MSAPRRRPPAGGGGGRGSSGGQRQAHPPQSGSSAASSTAATASASASASSGGAVHAGQGQDGDKLIVKIGKEKQTENCFVFVFVSSIFRAGFSFALHRVI